MKPINVPPKEGAERITPMALGARHESEILYFLIFKKNPSGRFPEGFFLFVANDMIFFLSAANDGELPFNAVVTR